jgi:hypothetical protein
MPVKLESVERKSGSCRERHVVAKDMFISSGAVQGEWREGHLEVGTLRRLRQFLMCGCGHESGFLSAWKRSYVTGVVSSPSYFDQDGLHGEVTLPLAQAGELGKVDLVDSISANMSYVRVFPGKTYLAVSLIHAGQVDL